MHIVHLLRKYDPAEWGGTESALHRLVDGLRQAEVRSTVYCPRTGNGAAAGDPLAAAGCSVRRFNACVPIWGLNPEGKRQMLAVGGNLMSFDLAGALRREPDVALIHAHTLGRLAAIARHVARRRRLPFVLTIHGGAYDLPPELRAQFATARPGFEWGKFFGWLFRSRHLLEDADAIVTCNPREAALMRQAHPDRRVLVQPHGVPAARYGPDQREPARAAFPWLDPRQLLLVVGRLDPVKNQSWLVEQTPELLRRHPNLQLVLAGACTDASYGEALRQRIDALGLGQRIRLTGPLPPADPRLIGLLQSARAVVLPSISETFGLVIIEAWAAGAPVIASQTSGARTLIEPRLNGWLFDLDRPETFHQAADELFAQPHRAADFAAAGRQRARGEFDTHHLARQLKQLYAELIDQSRASRHSARR